MNADTLRDIIIESKTRSETGFNSIMLPDEFPSLMNTYPGWVKGEYYCITASTNVGKTKFTKFITVYGIYKFCKDNNIPFHLRWYALEEDEEEFWLSITCMLMYKVCDINISIKTLKSLGTNRLSKEQLEAYDRIKPILDDMMKSIIVIDYIYHPTGIYYDFLQYADIKGKFAKLDNDGDIKALPKMFNNGEKTSQSYDYYYPENEDEYVFIIIDHISLLKPENKQNLREAIEMMSREYLLKKAQKVLKYIPIVVHQQALDSAKEQYTYKGETVIQKVMPSLAELGENRTVSRDYRVVMGLFMPHKHQISEFLGYDIAKLKEQCVFLFFLKDRLYGNATSFVPLLFNGANNTYKEMPTYDSDAMQIIYDGIDEARQIIENS